MNGKQAVDSRRSGHGRTRRRRGATGTGCATDKSGSASASAMHKHDCAGKNACKGQGGCKTAKQRVQGTKRVQGAGRLHVALRRPEWTSRCNSAPASFPGMPANRFNRGSPTTGSASACASPLPPILDQKPVVDWFEIISENFMGDGGRPLEILDRILEQYRVVQHGVSMYFGSTEPLNREHLRKLKRLVRRTGTPWISDHLCWGSVDGRYSHDLLPMPYTTAAARWRPADS